MALLSSLSGDANGNNKGLAEGIAARQKALQDIGAGALKNTTPTPVKKSPAPTAPQDKVNPKAQYGDKPGEKRIDTSGMTKPLGSFKKGGKVKKTGVYRLHKGERVLTKKQQAKSGLVGALAGKAKPSSFKDGGVVQKTGMAKVHAGEIVIPNPKGLAPRDSDTGAIAPGFPRDQSYVRKISTSVLTPRTHSMPFDTSNGKQAQADISLREQ